MDKNILTKNMDYYQLISVGIELSHTVLSLIDCNQELSNNAHYIKLQKCATKWNEIFFNLFITSHKGGK